MTTLAAHLADGMRTPLTCILGYVELLLDDPAGQLSEQQRSHLAAIARSARALERLAADLEAVAGGLPPGDRARAAVDLAALVGRAAERSGAEAGPLVPVECPGDPEALVKLVDTLIAAARSHANGPAATVSLRRVGTRAVIRIRATCDPHRAPRGAHALGLEQARAIAAAHGGRLASITGPPGMLTLRCELPASPAE